MNNLNKAERFRLVVVSAGTSDPSSTRLLADRTAERAVALAARHGHAATVSVVELRELAADISTALTSALVTPTSCGSRPADRPAKSAKPDHPPAAMRYGPG